MLWPGGWWMVFYHLLSLSPLLTPVWASPPSPPHISFSATNSSQNWELAFIGFQISDVITSLWTTGRGSLHFIDDIKTLCLPWSRLDPDNYFPIIKFSLLSTIDIIKIWSQWLLFNKHLSSLFIIIIEISGFQPILSLIILAALISKLQEYLSRLFAPSITQSLSHY